MTISHTLTIILLITFVKSSTVQSLTLQWDDSNNKEKIQFVLYEDIGCKRKWKVVDKSIPGNFVQYTITGIEFAIPYCYKITTRDNNEESNASNVVKYMCKRFDDEIVCTSRSVP